MADVFDNVIIGSGFAGAVTALRLSEAGLQSCLLERGRRYGPGDFPRPVQPENEGFRQKFRPDHVLWQLDQGLFDMRQLGDMSTLVGAGYGGGSLIYANVHIRPPAALFDDARWRDVGLDRPTLDPYYDRVERMLEVRPAPDTLRPDPETEIPIPKTEAFLSAAEALERPAARPNLAVRFDEGTEANAHGRPQGSCNGCGACDFGCQHQAKNTLDLNYLARAEDSGHVDVRTLAEVVRLEPAHGSDEDPGDGPRYVVWYVDHLTGHRLRSIRARRVFLCAGAIGSTELLLRSAHQEDTQPFRRLEGLSPRLGHDFAGNVDALGLVVDAKDAHGAPRHLDPNTGPVITATTIYDRVVDPISGAEVDDGGLALRGLVQDGGFPTEYSALFELLAFAFWPSEAEVRGELYPQVGRRVSRTWRRGVQRMKALLGLSSPEVERPTLDLGITLPAQLREAYAQTFSRSGRILTRQVLRRARLWDMLLLYFAQGAFRRQLTVDRMVQGAMDIPRMFLNPESVRADRAALLAMGRDLTCGRIRLHPERAQGVSAPRLHIEIDLGENSLQYNTQERLMRDMAHQLGGHLRVNPMWSLLRQPVTVHSQGGCPMGPTAEAGVVDATGEVHGHPGLYVLDAAIFPKPVGVNPSHTIAAIAEHHIERIIAQITGALPAERAGLQGEVPPDPMAPLWARAPSASLTEGSATGVRYADILTGFVGPVRPGGPPKTDYDHWSKQAQLRDEHSHRLQLDLQLHVPNLDLFVDRRPHISRQASITLEGDIRGAVTVGPEKAPHAVIKGVTGHFTLEARDPTEPPRPVTRGPLAFLPVPTGGQRTFRYRVTWTFPEEGPVHRDFKGRTVTLRGYKQLYGEPGADLISDFSTMYAVIEDESPQAKITGPALSGVLRVHLIHFLKHAVPSFRVTGYAEGDPQEVLATTRRFGQLVFGELWDAFGGSVSRGRPWRDPDEPPTEAP